MVVGCPIRHVVWMLAHCLHAVSRSKQVSSSVQELHVAVHVLIFPQIVLTNQGNFIA